ncbi:TlpA family protein disulfide reductase [bacterium]|nr:TlpA family protein disulfide reductase [bacterium]
MKRPPNVQILLYLILAAFAFEVVVLARQNMILKRQLSGRFAQQAGNQKEISDGMTLTPLKLTDFQDTEFTLTYTQPGKKTLLYFFSLTCPQCMRNIPQWRKLADELKDNPAVEVIGVSKGGREPVQQYANGYNLNFTVGVNAEADTTILKDYGIQYVPTTVLVDDSARVIRSTVGVLSDDKRQDILNHIYGNTVMK